MSARAVGAVWRMSIVALGIVLVATGCGQPTAPSTAQSVRVLAAWSGHELATFRSVVAPFEERTGIRVEYSATRDLTGTLERQLRSGRPPDIAGLAGPTHMAQLARAGALRDLGDAIDLRSYKASVAPTSLDAKLGDDDTNRVADIVADPNAEAPWQQAVEESDNAILGDVIRTLSPREQTILKLRFGLAGDDEKTLEEVYRALEGIGFYRKNRRPELLLVN